MLLVFFLKGIVVGIIIAVPVGPVGIMCIRRTVFEGKLAGFVSGLGAATADAVFGIIAGFGLTVVSDWLLDYQQWLRIAGLAFCSPWVDIACWPGSHPSWAQRETRKAFPGITLRPLQ